MNIVRLFLFVVVVVVVIFALNLILSDNKSLKLKNLSTLYIGWEPLFFLFCVK